LFFVRLKNSDGSLNNIKPIRLKDKLGTRQVPTAELILNNTVAEIASPEGKGITFIMELANITRLHNIMASISAMRRILAYVEDYSYKRVVFNKLLKDQPLHIMAYSNLKFMSEGCVNLLLELAKLQGISEFDRNKTNKIDLLRLLIPLAKLYTAKMSIAVFSEGMECIGGIGYMENSMIPNGLRDTFVTSIWEGTTNVLSLDFLRVVNHRKNSLEYYFKVVEKRINYLKTLGFDRDKLNLLLDIIKEIKLNLVNFLQKQENLRPLSFVLMILYIISLVAKASNKDKTSIYNEALVKFWISELRKYYLDLKLAIETSIGSLKKSVFPQKCQFTKF